MSKLFKSILKPVKKKKGSLADAAMVAGLSLAKGILDKPGIAAYLEYQIEHIFYGWSDLNSANEQVKLTTDAILEVFTSKGLFPNRIAVDGVPGSGKSTLATALADRLTMDVVCLDHRNMDQPIRFDNNRTIFEHHRLLRTQEIDSFDVIIYIDEPVAFSQQKVLRRKRGGYLVELMNYDRLKAIGDLAFSVASGETVSVGERFVRMKTKPEYGFKCQENIETLLGDKGLSCKGLNKEQTLFLCDEGRPKMGFFAYLNPRAFDEELLMALKQGLVYSKKHIKNPK